MDAQELNLLDAIANAPNETDPLLVYADWLDDLSNPRGTLLRLEHEYRHLADNPERLREIEAGKLTILEQGEFELPTAEPWAECIHGSGAMLLGDPKANRTLLSRRA